LLFGDPEKATNVEAVAKQLDVALPKKTEESVHEEESVAEKKEKKDKKEKKEKKEKKDKKDKDSKKKKSKKEASESD